MFGSIFAQKKNQTAQPVDQGQNVVAAQTPAPLQQSSPETVAPPPTAPMQSVTPAQSLPQAQDTRQPATSPEMSALSHLDPRASQVLTHAQEEAKRLKQQYIEPDQLLFGLLYDEQIYRLLGEFSVDGGALSKEIQGKEKMSTYQGQPVLSKTSQQVFDQAYRDAKMRGSNFITPEDIFVVLFSPNFSTAATLQAHGLKKETIIEKMAKNPNLDYGHKTILEKYGIDLTEEARAGHLDPIAGRDKEIDRVIHILLRRTKNNPIIIGETGVGKTAIVEGLAQKIVSGSVPHDLLDKRIFQLDVASLIAGASHRGEFEERLRGVINEVLGSNNHIILFIDEIHSLMGAGEGEGMNAANIIKPHLARGHFQLIGATTTTEYRKNFEKDKAFERRFQPVTAEEPSDENAFEMLKVLRPKYEKFHKVTVPDDALKECVKLSRKYIGERYLPDKAVDLLDEACSEVKLQMDAGKRGDNQVKKADIEKVVSAWTGIPITKLTEDESEKLLRLEDRIHKRLVDQEEAVVAVSEAVRRGRIGLAAANRPIASFVFLGPTGVGKTELAKTLAEILFGRDDAMARLDMSEYMEKHEVAKLIGAPPGYVGYEEGGQLTEAVRKKPYSIVLLDEIEKAHPDVFNILLQLLEDGRLTDNRGNTISFKNTIVICTSNIGSSLIQQQLNMQDPKIKRTQEEYNKTYKQLTSVVKEELIKFFRPELLNRFDEVVIFKPLRPEHMAGIARLGIAKTAALLKEQGFNLQITEKAIAQLAKDGYDPVYGARPLRRLIQTAIENPIALAIISKKFAPGDTIIIDYNDTANEFIFSKGGQTVAAVLLSDDQFKQFLQKIVNPDSILDVSEKLQYAALHEKVLKASVAGNGLTGQILSVTAETSQSQIQTIRKALQDAKAHGDPLAQEILALADTVANALQRSGVLRQVLLLLHDPSKITDAEKKEQFTKLHDQLQQKGEENDPLAMAILSVTDTTPAANIAKIEDELNKAKGQEDELAIQILSLVNKQIADEAEAVQSNQPLAKFKKFLQQLTNPLYAAAPDNKEIFNHLYDKISQANQQNHTLAKAILSITDITSDADIEQLKAQLEQAQAQGDPLAKEILDTIDAAITQDSLHRLKNTLLFIVNPLTAPTAELRETFTQVRDSITQASQKGNQLATTILGTTETISENALQTIAQQIENGKAQSDQIALLVDNAELKVESNLIHAPQQPVNPDQNYPFGKGQQEEVAKQADQSTNQTSAQPASTPASAVNGQMQSLAANQQAPAQQVQTVSQEQTPVIQQPFVNQTYSPQSFTGPQMNPVDSNGAALQPSGQS